MNKVDDLLEKMGLKYDDLTEAERRTYENWNKVLDSNQLSVPIVKSFVRSIRDSIEIALIDEPEFIYIFIFKFPNRKQILLKARLRNIMLIEAFLIGPQQAKEALSRALSGMVDSHKK